MAVGLVATAPAAVGVGVAGGYVVSDQIVPHPGQAVQEFGPQMGGVVYGQGLVMVFDDAIGWGATVFFFHEEAVGSQLQHVGAVGVGGRKRGLDFHGDHSSSLFDQVVWPTGEQMASGEEGFLAALPGPRVGVDYPALGETGPLSLAAGPI